MIHIFLCLWNQIAMTYYPRYNEFNLSKLKQSIQFHILFQIISISNKQLRTVLEYSMAYSLSIIWSNEVFKRISISIIINQSIILELFNSVTFRNDLFNLIPSSVSDGMSNSNTIINHHSPMSFCWYKWNHLYLPWAE